LFLWFPDTVFSLPLRPEGRLSAWFCTWLDGLKNWLSGSPSLAASVQAAGHYGIITLPLRRKDNGFTP